MLTRKGALALAVLVAGATAAVLLDAWVLAVALVPVAFALLAGLVAVEGRRLPVDVDLRAEPSVAIVGESVVVATEVRRPGLFRGPAEVALALPGSVSLAEGETYALVPAGARTASSRAVLLAEGAGRPSVAGVDVREADVLGSFRRATRAGAPAEVTVYPAEEPIEGTRWARRARVVQGAHRVGRAGAGQEFWALREYLPGDSMDLVNWRKTAQYRRPIVNEFEHESPVDVVFVLDARAPADVGAGLRSAFQASLRATASLSARALQDQCKVGLVVFGRRVEWVPPSLGRRQHEKILGILVDLAADGWYDLDRAFADAPYHFLPKGAQVVVVTPITSDPSVARVVDELVTRRQATVTVLAPSPETAEVADAALGARGPSSARIVGLARARFLDAVRAAGATVVAWDPTRPLAEAWVEAQPPSPRRPLP